MRIAVEKQDLIYPELSYKLIGIAFEVFNELGFGHLEKTYQKAFSKELKTAGLVFDEQIKHAVIYKEENIGNYYFDFKVDGKVVIELKKSGYMSKKNIEQISNYLKVSGLKLGLLIVFTPDGVRYKRIVNDY